MSASSWSGGPTFPSNPEGKAATFPSNPEGKAATFPSNPEDKIFPPRNLSLRWISAFTPALSWEPVTNCTYLVNITPGDSEKAEFEIPLKTPDISKFMIMEGGFLHWSVRTLCNGKKSEAATFRINYPELVENLECYSYSSTRVRCSWSPKRHIPDLRVFYQLEHSISEPLECYHDDTGDGQSSCDLEATPFNDIYIFFNGTWNNTSVRNTFEKSTISNVRPPPLTFHVTKTGNKLNISWVAPEVLAPSSWRYKINYTECNQMKELSVEGLTSYTLNVVPRCRYCVSVVAQRDAGSTPPGDQICVGSEEDGTSWLYIIGVIPLVFAGMTLLFIVCYRRNKDSIFPKIPQPRNLLSDISNNNNMEDSHFYLYCPVEKEVSCEVTLVADT